MKYFLETYGCEMNKAESAAMEAELLERGWLPGSESDADLVIINTCTVRATAENRAWARISLHAAEKRKRRFSLMVVGCMAEQYRGEMRKRVPAVDYVLGTSRGHAFGLALDQISLGSSYDIADEEPSHVFASTHHSPGAFRSFVPIMHGCNNFCSYCIVPYVRGREVSRDPAAIMGELSGLESLGVREVTLLGQNVNSYRWQGPGGDMDFASLLRAIAARFGKGDPASPGAKGIGWMRFLTSHPKDLSDDLIGVLADEPLYCRHVHLCLQAGSDAVLARMNRKYTRGYFLELARKMREAIPGLSLSSDILVGFPGETEDDLEATLEMMRKVRFAYCFMYHFNPRRGTPAAEMEGAIPDKVKKTRLARVIALQKEITGELLRERIGQTDIALVEGPSKRSAGELLARTARDEMVVFKGEPSRAGQFVRLRIRGISGNTLKAEEVNE